MWKPRESFQADRTANAMALSWTVLGIFKDKLQCEAKPILVHTYIFQVSVMFLNGARK